MINQWTAKEDDGTHQPCSACIGSDAADEGAVDDDRDIRVSACHGPVAELADLVYDPIRAIYGYVHKKAADDACACMHDRISDASAWDPGVLDTPGSI